jgi:hypothetical protein
MTQKCQKSEIHIHQLNFCMHVEEGQEFIEDRGVQYTDIQVLNKAYNHIFQLSCFKRSCH